jgi:hypothetical protein
MSLSTSSSDPSLYGESLISMPGKTWSFASADFSWHLTDTPEVGSQKIKSTNFFTREVTYKTKGRDVSNAYYIINPRLVIEFIARRIFGTFATGCAYATVFPVGTAVKAVHSGIRWATHIVGNHIYKNVLVMA